MDRASEQVQGLPPTPIQMDPMSDEVMLCKAYLDCKEFARASATIQSTDPLALFLKYYAQFLVECNLTCRH
jgi:hypothetical protein